MLKIDRDKLGRDIRAITCELRDLKKILRENGQPRVTWRTYADISAAKRRATLLYSLAAHCRGRLHRPSKMTLEDQHALVRELLEDYQVPEPVEAAAA